VNGSVGAIVLAAGASRRLGQPKQLLMHGGETLLECAIRIATEAGANPVLTVLGAHAAFIRSSTPAMRSISVVNDRWEHGISTSIHAGLDALDEAAPNARGALILACDQPRLTADHLRALIENFAGQEEHLIVASAYAGVLGIPAVFPRVAFAHLRLLSGDKGARALLVHPPCPLVSLPLPGGEVDIDQPEDLDQLE
jgi:molybdenum cofactor cytidylyltransferase